MGSRIFTKPKSIDYRDINHDWLIEYNQTTDPRRKEWLKNKIARLNFKLVAKEAHKWKLNKNIPLTVNELISIGNEGLVQAIIRFDPSKGYAFSTFAVFHIKGAVQRHLRDFASIVRIPQNLQSKHAKVRVKLGDIKVVEIDNEEYACKLTKEYAPKPESHIVEELLEFASKHTIPVQSRTKIRHHLEKFANTLIDQGYSLKDKVHESSIVGDTVVVQTTLLFEIFNTEETA